METFELASNDFVGLVIETSDDYSIEFIAGKNNDLKIGAIVGVTVNKQIFVLGEIKSIRPQYYIKDAEEYFLARAAKGELSKIIGSEVYQRIALAVQARILGFYTQDGNGKFNRITDAPNRYTCKPLQPVYFISMEKAQSIYSMAEDGLDLGKLCFPEMRPCLLRSDCFFQKHTLITGVSGAGKTRLAALLMARLASVGANIIIIDPHNEYESILTKNSFESDLSKYSREFKGHESVKINGRNVFHAPIQFGISQMTAQTLVRLLPEINRVESEAIHRGWRFAVSDESSFSIESLSRALHIIRDNIKGHYKGTNHISALIESYNSVIRKFSDACHGQKPHLITKTLPKWMAAAPGSISILSGDPTDRFTGRYISTVLQHILTNKVPGHECPKILVVDECHQLFREDSIAYKETSGLVEQLLREARKFETGLVLVTQVKGDIPHHVRDQIQNRFQFRTSDVPELSNLADRLCEVSLYGSQSKFIMQVHELS